MPKKTKNPFIRSVSISRECIRAAEDALGWELEDQLWWIEKALDKYGEFSVEDLENDLEERLEEFERLGHRDSGLASDIDAIRAVLAIKACKDHTLGASDEKPDINDDDIVADEIAYALDVDVDELFVDDNNDFRNVTVKEVHLGNSRFIVFASEEDAVEAAQEYVYDQITSEPELFNQDWLAGFVDEKQLKRTVEEMVREDEYIEELARHETDRFWELAEEYGFDVPEEDEDGDIPDPTDGQIEEVKDKWVEGKLKDPMDVLSDLIPTDELPKWLGDNIGIKTSEAAEAAVREDGWEHFLSRIDGNSYTTSGGFVYVQTQGRPIGRDAPKGKPQKYLEPL